MYSQQQYMYQYPRQQYMYPRQQYVDPAYYNSMSGPYIASLQTELLSNGDFSLVSTVDPTRPGYWNKWQPVGANGVFTYPEVGLTSTSKAVSISRTATTTVGGAIWSQNVRITPGKTYQISGYIKTESVTGSGGIGGTTTGATIAANFKDASGIVVASSAPVAKIIGTTAWTYYQANVSTTAATATNADVFGSLSGGSTGKAYFANMSFKDMSTVTTPTPPPATSPTPPPTGTCPVANQVYVPLIGCQNKYYIAGGIGAFVLLLIITR